MLSPKRTNFRKQHRGRMRGVASKGNTIAFGQFALQAQDCGWVTARQIEANNFVNKQVIPRIAENKARGIDGLDEGQLLT